MSLDEIAEVLGSVIDMEMSIGRRVGRRAAQYPDMAGSYQKTFDRVETHVKGCSQALTALNALCVMAFFLGMEQGINEKLGMRLLVRDLLEP